MSQTDWQITDELCDTCGQPKYGQTTTTPTGQSARSVRNDPSCRGADCHHTLLRADIRALHGRHSVNPSWA